MLLHQIRINMQTRSVQQITTGHSLQMGAISVRQPLPTQQVEQVDPFILLHHFGPTTAEPGFDPLDLGPHPHRGFEPVTFLYQGALRHRDSRGNTGHLQAGDVQWMTAGMGIIHSERAHQDFVEQGGTLEGIQLWVNLPKRHKMVQPRYQDIKQAQIPLVAMPDPQAAVRLVAGTYLGLEGPAMTYTPMLALQIELPAGAEAALPLPADWNALIYLLRGEVQLNDNWNYGAETLLTFRQDGEGIKLRGVAERSQVLLLAGEPLNEPVAQWGPFVMNNQTELMEAMRDYQMGKMGVYVEHD